MIEPTAWALDAWGGPPMIRERCPLPESTTRALRDRPVRFGFGLFGEAVYRRTYSRWIESEKRREDWADTVVRVVEGVLAVRKQWYVDHRLPWDEGYWRELGAEMAEGVFDMRWLPPGRGLWIVGTDNFYERGSAAAQNCAFTRIDVLSEDLPWLMEALMVGAGVGFTALPEPPVVLHEPEGEPHLYLIPDTKEGWCESVHLLLEAYERGSAPVAFDYSGLRPAGAPLRSFGGVASGPKPLEDLHEQVRATCSRYVAGGISPSRLRTDLANQIGCCVVAGNVRRSSEIALGSPDDDEFWRLKSREMREDRPWFWASNNSLLLRATRDFWSLPRIARGIVGEGEPGFVNMKNVAKFGRFGRTDVDPDNAEGCNPCGEQPLASRECCTLVETVLPRCRDEAEWCRAVELAMLYGQTITLAPTHWPRTNAIMGRNRRIGVGIMGMADWLEAGTTWCEATRILRRGYERARAENRRLALDAGVNPSIRVTTSKPGGTTPKLPGASPGMHWPTANYMIRRMRVGRTTSMARCLVAAGVPHEPDFVSAGTEIFEFPVANPGRCVDDVTMWEQLAMCAAVQREWSDNMVSCTVHFDPEAEGRHVEQAISAYAPVLKSLSMLPRDPKVYQQMPEEPISREEYERRVAAMPAAIDYSSLAGDGDGSGDLYCDKDGCEVRPDA